MSKYKIPGFPGSFSVLQDGPTIDHVELGMRCGMSKEEAKNAAKDLQEAVQSGDLGEELHPWFPAGIFPEAGE